MCADPVRRAATLNAPPLAREITAHQGNWPRAVSFVCCSAPNVVLTVLKQAEVGQDWILRGYETEGKATEVIIRLGMEGKSWPILWQPYEIKTLRIAQDGAPMIVNMLEE